MYHVAPVTCIFNPPLLLLPPPAGEACPSPRELFRCFPGRIFPIAVAQAEAEG